MSILSGLYSTLLCALMLSGADKLLRPSAAAAALTTGRLVPVSAAKRLRLSRVLARALGLAEVVIGVGAGVGLALGASTDARWAVAPGLVALVYLGFAWFMWRVDVISPGASCGCFGSGSTAGPLHLAANLVAAIVSAATATIVLGSDDPHLRQVFDDAGVAIPFVAAVGIGALMFLLAPSLLTEVRRAQHQPSQTVNTFSIKEPIRR